MQKRVYTLCFLTTFALTAQGVGKSILFDHTRHEEAGSTAEWIICRGFEPDPNPTHPTKETDWAGALSSLAFDLYNQGYHVQTLPASGGRITYGDSTNAQDLSHYSVFFIPECYICFTTAEKQAIIHFVQNGGGLFLMGNHKGAARIISAVPGSTDAVSVFNDLVANNGFGLSWVAGHASVYASITSTTYSPAFNTATNAIIRGPNGTLSKQDFHSYSFVQVNTVTNPSAQGILSSSVPGDACSNYLIATCTLGNGRVVAMGDSSPVDDGTTTTPGKDLYNSYWRYSNRAFFLNAIEYLAESSTLVSNTLLTTITTPSGNMTVPSGTQLSFAGTASGSDTTATINYEWDFGDGYAATGSSTSHVYVNSGSTVVSYTVKLTATDYAGATGMATRTITVTPISDSYLSETFEAGTKTSYTTGTIQLASGPWTFTNTLLGNADTDHKNGCQSARMRNRSELTMGFDFIPGAKMVTLTHAVYGSDTSSTWALYASTDSGNHWTQVGTTITTTSTSPTAITFTVNVPNPIRFQIRKTDSTSSRLNVDDFCISGY